MCGSFVVMVASTPFPSCSQCAIVSRSSSSLTSAASASSSAARWIEDNWRLNNLDFQVGAALVRSSRSRLGSFLSSQVPINGYGTGCCVSLTSNSTITSAAVKISEPGCANDDKEFGEASVQRNCNAQIGSMSLAAMSVAKSQPWPLFDGVNGWLLGLAMACLIMAGEAAPNQSQAAMPAPRYPRTGYDLVSKEEREASSVFARRVTEALELLDKARKVQASEDFLEALRCYSLITQNSGDLALAEYARVGRALTLYEVGDRSEAIAEMEDMSLSLKGYPEVHAALAAALYADKHAPVPAEQQFTFATLLDRRYTDPSWVKSAKHWPPSLIVSLQRFIALK